MMWDGRAKLVSTECLALTNIHCSIYKRLRSETVSIFVEVATRSVEGINAVVKEREKIFEVAVLWRARPRLGI